MLAEVAVIVMALLWGINYSVVKFGTGLVSPLAYNAVRVSIAAVALWVIARLWGGEMPARRDALALAGLGMLGNGIYQIFFAEGIAHTRAGEAALVVGASPALMAVIGRMRGVERVTKLGVVGIVLSFFGIALVVLGRAASGPAVATGGGGGSGGSLFGDLLVLCGSVCWALYTVLLVPYTKRVNGWYIVSLTMAGGSIVLILAGLPQIVALEWRAVPWPAWAAILYGSVFALVVAYMLWYRGVKILGPTRTALFGNLQPLIALVVAWITLHETPTTWQALGCATIVGGVLLTRVAATEAS